MKKFSNLLALAGLFVFALSLWLSSAAAYMGLALILIVFCSQVPSRWERIRRDPIVVLFVLFIVFLGVQALWLQSSGESDFSFKQAWDWISLWLFFVTAYAIGGEEKYIKRCLVLAVVGLFLRFGYEIIFDIGWGPFVELLQERRHGFFFSVNEAGHHGALLLFGFLIFFPALMKAPATRLQGLLAICFWLIGFGGALEILVLSGSRSSWLAFLLASIIFVPWVFFGKRNKKPLSKKIPHLGLIMLACVLIGGIVALNLKGFQKNLHFTLKNNAHMIRQLLSIDLNSLPFENWDESEKVQSSIGRRIILGYYGLKLIRERPWLGWGTELNLPKLLSEKTGSRKIGERKHLHNGYLILLARFGIIGTIPFVLGAGFLLRSLYRAYRSGSVSRDMYGFLLGALLITAVVSLVNFRWTQMDFRFVWLLLAGMAYAGGVGGVGVEIRGGRKPEGMTTTRP